MPRRSCLFAEGSSGAATAGSTRNDFAALAAIEDLTGRTRTGDARPEGLEAVLRTSLRDPSLRIGYVVPGREGFVDAAGSDVPADGGVVVRQAGRPVAVLAAASTPGTRELLDTVGRASIGLMDVVRLRLELAGALRDVEASRMQLVTVGERERRRLERDLHDGSQQRLVALGMALRLAQRHLDEGSVDVHGLLDQSVAELGTAVAELREIAHGLRPSRLDDGLRAALVSLAERLAVPVDLEITSGALPDDVAATAYYVASEALTNAVKHADADRIEVRVVRSEALVEVRIADDGRGGARSRPGPGSPGWPTGSPRGAGHSRCESPRPRHGHRSGAAVRIVIAEDGALFREGLARLLADAGHAIVGVAGDAETLRAVVADTMPDLAVIDIRMPPTHTDDGARVATETERPGRRSPSCCCRSMSRRPIRSISSTSGRFGYLLKDRVLDVDDFLDSLERVAARRLRAGPRGGSRARAGSSAGRRAGPAHGTRARGAGADGGGQDQRRDRPPPLAERSDRGNARQQHHGKAGSPVPTTRTTGACWRS